MKYCALDWYCQTTAQRLNDAEVWDHYLILDQVCPTQFFKAECFKSMPVYRGWRNHEIGLA